MTDVAPPPYGTLSWAVSGDVAKFTAPAFAATSTLYPPHANSFAFDIPASTPPGDYVLHVHVTSSVTSSTSSDATVILRVLPPAIAISSDNPLGIFELDQSGNIIDSDGSSTRTTGDSIVPDLPYVPGATAPASVRIASTKVQFDPLHPPAAFVNTLMNETGKGLATCGALLVTDNAAHDPTSGTPRGAFAFYGYCAPKELLADSPEVTYVFDAVNLNSSKYMKDSGVKPLPCAATGQTWGVFGICSTASTDMRPLTGQSELQQFKYGIALGSGGTPVSDTLGTEGNYIINYKGTFYPKVAVDKKWGLADFDSSDGKYYAPFSPKVIRLIHYCPHENPSADCFNSQNNSATLGKALEKEGFIKPGPGFEAHHIQPTSWGGDDTYGNGVWLARPDHVRFSAWWNIYNFKVN